MTSAAAGQPPPAAARVEATACPHEPPCPDSVWVARGPLHAYRARGDRTRVAFTAAPGDSLRVGPGYLVTERAGRVAVVRSDAAVGLARGDTVYVLGYRGEGEYAGWVHGRPRALGAVLWEGPDAAGRLVTPARMTWWVAVTDPGGRRGWLALRNTAGMEGMGFGEPVDMRPGAP